MNSTIESAFASTYADDRIRQAAVSRQARAARRDASAGTPKRRWFMRSARHRRVAPGALGPIGLAASVARCEAPSEERTTMPDDTHESVAPTAADLKAVIEAERTGLPFVHWRTDRRPAGAAGAPARARAADVGRRPDSDLALGWDTEVSRAHALLELRRRAVDRRRRRAVAQRDVRQRQPRPRPPSAARPRPSVLRADAALIFREPPDPEHGASTAQAPGNVAARAAVGDPAQGPRSRSAARCNDSTAATPATNRQIADEVFLSVDAVKAHLRVLFDRFGVGELPQNEKRARLAAEVLLDGVAQAARLLSASVIDRPGADVDAVPVAQGDLDDAAGSGRSSSLIVVPLLEPSSTTAHEPSVRAHERRVQARDRGVAELDLGAASPDARRRPIRTRRRVEGDRPWRFGRRGKVRPSGAVALEVREVGRDLAPHQAVATRRPTPASDGAGSEEVEAAASRSSGRGRSARSALRARRARRRRARDRRRARVAGGASCGAIGAASMRAPHWSQ